MTFATVRLLRLGLALLLLHQRSMADDKQQVFDITAFGMVRNAERVLPKRIMDLVPLACDPAFNLKLRVMEGGSQDQTRAKLEGIRENRSRILCKRGGAVAFQEIEIIDEPTDLVNGLPPSFDKAGAQQIKGDEDKRIVRIAYLRDYLRGILRSRDKTQNALIMIDFDLEKFPDMNMFRAHLHRLVQGKSTSGYNVICTNGQTAYRLRTWLGLTYYDTYATVLANGSYPYERIVAPKSPDKTLGKVLTNEINEYTEPIYPVNSCFGGIAMYTPNEYFDERCRYSGGTKKDKYAAWVVKEKSMGYPCEHVTFHMCLVKEIRLKLGVAKNLIAYWLPAGQEPQYPDK